MYKIVFNLRPYDTIWARTIYYCFENNRSYGRVVSTLYWRSAFTGNLEKKDIH